MVSHFLFAKITICFQMPGKKDKFFKNTNRHHSDEETFQ